jgi:hypothetical protein
MNIRLKTTLKFFGLYSLLITTRLMAELLYVRFCFYNIPTFIVANGSPVCAALRTAADMPMEKFITYIN